MSLGIIFGIFKSFFGGLITRIFSDWRILAVLAVMGFAGLVLWRLHSLETNLQKTHDQLVQEKENNQTLRGNVTQLEQVNQGNQAVIDQLQRDKQRAINSVTTLTKELADVSKSLGAVDQKIDSIKDAPTKLSPYFTEAINGIQTERDKLNPPPQPPKEPTK